VRCQRDLAREHPDHRESAEQRIREGKAELATLREQERQLVQGPYPPPG
jgi:hypothetical protein